MIDVSTFTPWTFFSDMGFILILLLIGKVIRVYVKFIQKLFIPPSLIAGLLGLTLGPNGLGWVPFSNNLGTYAAIFIALVFAALPLASPKFKAKEVVQKVGPMWAFAQFGMLFQWAIAGMFGLVVIKLIWPSINSAFGIMLSTGFYGGHGTAAAIGDSFKNFGWDEARSLGMTTATVGVVVAIVGGLIMVKWAARNNHTKFIADFNDLPNELRSGLIPASKRESSGDITISPISIDTLTFHAALVTGVALVGYLFSLSVKSYAPSLELPVFSCAFIIGLIAKKIFDRLNVSNYICPKTTSQLSSSFTDMLVACGVASIQLSVVVEYAIPLVVIIVFGIITVWLTTFIVGRILLKDYWFERSIFAWGWWTGTMAMGIALLRIVDPKTESQTMDNYALAYLPIAPLEILLITLVPIAFINDMGWWLVIGCFVLSMLTLLVAYKMGWTAKGKRKK